MSRLLETKKKKELKSRGNESHFFLSTQSFPKAKILSKYRDRVDSLFIHPRLIHPTVKTINEVTDEAPRKSNPSQTL